MHSSYVVSSVYILPKLNKRNSIYKPTCVDTSSNFAQLPNVLMVQALAISKVSTKQTQGQNTHYGVLVACRRPRRGWELEASVGLELKVAGHVRGGRLDYALDSLDDVLADVALWRGRKNKVSLQVP